MSICQALGARYKQIKTAFGILLVEGYRQIMVLSISWKMEKNTGERGKEGKSGGSCSGKAAYTVSSVRRPGYSEESTHAIT